MVSENSGVSLGAAFKADLWEKYHMAAPRQRRRYSADLYFGDEQPLDADRHPRGTEQT